MNRLVYLLLFLFSTFSFGVEAQGLCDGPNAVPNGFKLDANVGCHPFRVTPQDQSGWSDVKYIFDYRGQAASELSRLNPALTDVLFKGPNDQPKTYTILQYGKDANGVEKYSCQNVTVRVDLKPIASFNVCNNTTVEISIPADSRNNHDEYLINWGTGTTTIQNQDLPYNQIRTIPINGEISIKGEYSGQVVSCDSRTTFRNLGNSTTQNAGKIKIESIKLIDKMTAEIIFEGSYTPDGYKLFMTQSGVSPNFSSPIQSNVTPGRVLVNLPDSTSSYCFTLTKEEICGGTEVSHDFCTNPILDLKNTGENNVITWIPHSGLFYNQFLAFLFGYRNNTITRVKEDLESGDLTEIGISPNSPSIDPVECEKRYCYSITTRSQGVLFNRPFSYTSTSNKVCIDTDQLKAPAITSLFASYSDIEQDKKVEFEDNSTWPVDREKYFVMTLNSNNELEKLDSILATQNSFSLGISSDTCFYVSFVDKCGVMSEKSPEVCTVNLDLGASDELVWTSNNPFSNEEVASFEVFAKNEDSGIFEFLGDRSNAFQDFNPDLSNFINEAIFKVKVISQAGTVSWSNFKAIPLFFKLYLPDAFSPNQDGENDLLELKGSLGRAASLSFEVYDRWGNQVFVSDSKDLKWDASFRGKTLPMGQYVYTFNALLNDGSTYKQNGVLEILK